MPTPALRVAMRQTESGGNYSALGPVMKTGSYKGDRAYGAYQVMGRNIPQWTEQALGKRMTPKQFLANRKAQDAVFDYKFGQSMRRYGNYRDAASIWHSGVPLAQAQKRTDGYMTTVDYVNKFSSYASGERQASKGAAKGYNGKIAPEQMAEDTPIYNAASINVPAMPSAMQAAANDFKALEQLRKVAASGKFKVGLGSTQLQGPRPKAPITPKYGTL